MNHQDGYIDWHQEECNVWPRSDEESTGTTRRQPQPTSRRTAGGSCPLLSEHLFLANSQHKHYEALRARRPFPQKTLVMVMYFAKNCQYQDEVQWAHWNHNQVTIHPISTYYTCSSCDGLVNEGFVFISNDLTHDYHAVQNVISLRPCGLIDTLVLKH